MSAGSLHSIKHIHYQIVLFYQTVLRYQSLVDLLESNYSLSSKALEVTIAKNAVI